MVVAEALPHWRPRQLLKHSVIFHELVDVASSDNTILSEFLQRELGDEYSSL